MVTVIRPSRARCVNGRIPRLGRAVFTFKEGRMLVAFDLSLRLQLHYSCRQLLASVVIAASRVARSRASASDLRAARRPASTSRDFLPDRIGPLDATDFKCPTRSTLQIRCRRTALRARRSHIRANADYRKHDVSSLFQMDERVVQGLEQRPEIERRHIWFAGLRRL